jgi:hypothetical protein
MRGYFEAPRASTATRAEPIRKSARWHLPRLPLSMCLNRFTARFGGRAPVAQLDRAPDYESGGQEFESSPVRHLTETKQALVSHARLLTLTGSKQVPNSKCPDRYESKGQRFESFRARHSVQGLKWLATRTPCGRVPNRYRGKPEQDAVPSDSSATCNSNAETSDTFSADRFVARATSEGCFGSTPRSEQYSTGCALVVGAANNTYSLLCASEDVEL